MSNDVKLQEGHPVDENLRPIKVGGKSTAIETAQHGNGARVNGDLEVTGNIKGTAKDMVLEDIIVDSLTTDSIISTDLNIDASGDIILDSGGNFVSKRLGTEFSVANSAYAGMILGYTTVGIDTADDSYAVSNAFVNIATLAGEHKVTFIAPPSGTVEIAVSIFADCASSGRPLYLGLSDNATYNTVDVTHEHEVATGDETDEYEINHHWVITGLTSGTSYTYYLGAKSSHSFVWILRWGGNITAEYAPFIMKVTALPTATADFAVYG